MRFEPLKERAKGRWLGILSALGIAANFLKNQHGPCPMCGGKDRFRFDDKGGYGTWICSHCDPKSGDGIELVKRYFGVEFKEAAQRIEPLIGEAVVLARKDELTDARKSELSKQLWTRSKLITRDCPAGIYLFDRCGLTEFPDCLRWAPDERYPADVGKRATCHPAMVAMMQAPDGSKVNLHRTYLTRHGMKADLQNPRAMMPGSIMPGSAVRLMPADETIGIAEGIETALSAAAIFGVSVWAALSAWQLERWTPPASAKRVMIFGDNDLSNTGQAAAYALAARLTAKGMPLEVHIPPTPGDDWNDFWIKKGRQV